MRQIIILLMYLVLGTMISIGQDSIDYGKLDASKQWVQVAVNQSDKWYESAEAERIAAILVQTQTKHGGWVKNKKYHALPDLELKELILRSTEMGGTFDNGSTSTELRFLARVYAAHRKEVYRESFIKGINYILRAQYNSGGWPQFFPVEYGVKAYSDHITFNDGAMVNVLTLLDDVYHQRKGFAIMRIPKELRKQTKTAFNKGVECILDTQIQINDTLTVWCAQHDKSTFLPAKARSYELPSFSGAESAAIVLLLMDIADPSPRLINSVHAAVNWFERHKIQHVKLEKVVDQYGISDIRTVEDTTAKPLWARFYDLSTSKPYYCDRDGVKRGTIKEIGHERRNNYSWFSELPNKVLERYEVWIKNI